MKAPYTVAPLETPTQCQAWFHGAEGQCTRTAAWTISRLETGTSRDFCADCAAPYRKQAALYPDPAQQDLGI